MPEAMTAPLRMALLGFDAAERHAIAMAIAMAAASQDPGCIVWVANLDDAALLLVNADDAPAVRLVMATERLTDTVFVGRSGVAPPGAVVCMVQAVNGEVDAPLLLLELQALRAAKAARAIETAEVAEVAEVAIDTQDVEPANDAEATTMSPTGTAKRLPTIVRAILSAVPAAAVQTAPSMSSVPFTLPAPAPASAPADAAPRLVVPPLALVVSMAPELGESLGRRLQQWGLEVVWVADGAQIRQQLQRRAFDCVFIDLSPCSADGRTAHQTVEQAAAQVTDRGGGQLSSRTSLQTSVQTSVQTSHQTDAQTSALSNSRHWALDGLALCRQVKRGLPGGPVPWVALLAGQGGQAERVRGALAGCDAFLARPLDEAELLRLLWCQGLAPRPPRPPRPPSAPPGPARPPRPPWLSPLRWPIPNSPASLRSMLPSAGSQPAPVQ